MDALILLITEHRKLKPVSINTYRANLTAMDYFNHTPAEHIDNIKNCGFSDSTKRARYTALLVALNPKNIQCTDAVLLSDDCPDELQNQATEILEAKQELWKLTKKYKKEANTKNEKEKEKWITWKQVLKNRSKLRYKMIKQYGWKMSDNRKQWAANMKKKNGKILPGEQRDLECWVLANLYTYLPPRRNDYNHLCYAKFNRKDNDQMIMDKFRKGSDNKDFPYPCVVLRGKASLPKQIYIPAVACKSNQGDCLIDIPKKLQKVLSWYIYTLLRSDPKSIATKPYLLAEPLWNRTKNNFGRILKDALGVGSQMLRKIYLTSQYAELEKKKEKDAKLMNHSLKTQKQSYIKMS